MFKKRKRGTVADTGFQKENPTTILDQHAPSQVPTAIAAAEIDSSDHKDSLKNQTESGNVTYYRGSNSYKDYTGTKEKRNKGLIKKDLVAPQKAPTNVRVTCRFDFQMDICKDYKETGYCGFGDSCKFLHDRSDYKNSWQLDNEWDEQKNSGNLQPNKSEKFQNWHTKVANLDKSDGDGTEPESLLCSICGKVMTSPVETICKHFFCESCLLSRFKQKRLKCKVCKANTNGTFTKSAQMEKQLKQFNIKQKEREADIKAKMAESGML